jgi:hypothetical protein
MASVIDALICFLLRGFPGPKAFIATTFHVRNSGALRANGGWRREQQVSDCCHTFESIERKARSDVCRFVVHGNHGSRRCGPPGVCHLGADASARGTPLPGMSTHVQLRGGRPQHPKGAARESQDASPQPPPAPSSSKPHVPHSSPTTRPTPPSQPRLSRRTQLDSAVMATPAATTSLTLIEELMEIDRIAKAQR